MDQLHLRPVVQVSAERAQYIIDTPARYTQEVFFGLQHNSHGILLELHSFMCEHHELHTNLMYIFIEQGIMHGLVHFALNNGFRYMEDANDLELMTSIAFDTLVHLLYIVDEMNPNHIGPDRYSEIVLQVKKTIAREKVALSRFLQIIWRRRRGFILEPRYPEDRPLGKAFSTWCLWLCIFCKKQDTRLLGSAYEIFPWLLYYWARQRAHPSKCLRVLETMGFLSSNCDDRENGETPSGVHGIHGLMKFPEEAANVVEVCLWSIRTDVVDNGLQHLLTMIGCLAWLCPKENHEVMRKHWIPLLAAVIRGCERQLCSGGDESSCSSVLYAGYVAMFYLRVLAPEGMPFFTSASGKENPVDSELIALLARCSPRIVTELKDSSDFLRVIVDVHKTAAKEFVRSHDQTVLPMLLCTARRWVPATIAALGQMTSLPPGVARRRVMLLSAWLQYYSALGLLVSPNVEDIEHPPQIAPWLTCASKACFCSGKRPHHKLRVCKGCYQTFYCGTKCQILDWNKGGHAEICRRRASLNKA